MAGRYTPEERKRINALRYKWHEHVIADVGLSDFPTAIRLAGHIMHRFNPDHGYAEFSFASAARELNMHRTSVIRARNKLIERGWIAMQSKPDTRTRAWRAARYTLSGGPEDLVFDEHASGHMGETDEGVT